MLTIKNLSHTYNNNNVLKNINITVNKGQIVSILGSSGVGKTTLFNIIAGLTPLQTGEIKINNSNDYLGHISYMLQKDLLLEHKTVLENIMLPLIIKKISKEQAIKEAETTLKLFNLYNYKNSYPKQLSGGMRQRVALLRTYMMKNELFLLDEPFNALDSITKIKLHTWYLEISKKLNLTTLLITHDIDEAIELSDKIYIIKNKPGEIVEQLIINWRGEKENTNKELKKINYKNHILNILDV